MTKHFSKTTALSASVLVLSLPVFCQVAPANWSGQVQCQLDDQDQSYSRHEIQTWTLVGGGPVSATGVPVYEATWSATGQGALQRVQGAQTTNIRWTTNVPPTRATIARASDNRLIIKPWHSQELVDYTLNGMRQIVLNGVAQQPTNFSKSVWEWQFPRIEDSPTNTNVSGSTQSQADSGDAELLHHYGGMPPNAVCRWQFTKGGMGPTNSNQTGISGGQSNQNSQGSMAGNTNYQNSGQSCESPATVQQSFENMKSNLQSQYSQLIQGTSDPSQVAALTSQEQRMLATMNAQEQHDMTAASQGCVQASNQGGNSYAGGSSNPGGAGNPGAGGGSNSYAGGGAANAGGSNAGGPGAAGAGSSAGAAGSNSSAGGAAPNAGGSNAGGAGAAGAGSHAGAAGNNSSAGGAGPNGSSGSTNQPANPQLLSITPTSVSQGSTIQVNLVGQGTHWSNATNVSFGPQVTLQSFSANPSGTSAVATINVASNASPGSRGVMLMSGTEMVGLSSGLTVTAAPAQQGSSGTNSSPMRINTGSGFAGSSVVLAGMLTGVSPATNNGQQNITVTLSGQRTNFVNGATTVTFTKAAQPGSTTALPANSFIAGLNHTTSTPPPVQVGPVNVSSATSATLPLAMNPTAAAGTYNVTVTTPTSNGTETLTLNNAFTVTATPTLSGVPLNPGGVVAKNTGTTLAAPSSATYRVTMTGLMCMRHITGGGDAISAKQPLRAAPASMLTASALQPTMGMTEISPGVIAPAPAPPSDGASSSQAPSNVPSNTVLAKGPIESSSLNKPPAILQTLPAPSGFTATHLGNGVVQFTWQPVSGASKYHLEGAGISSAGLSLAATSNSSGQGVPPPPPVVQNVPPGPGTWRLAAVNSFDKWDANAEATASAMVRYPPPHAPQWLSKSNGAGSPGSVLAHYLSLCNQCIPGANFKDVMQNLGLSLGPLALDGDDPNAVPFGGGWSGPWVDGQAARYTNVTEFEGSARVTGCWDIGSPNGRIICYTKTSDHGLQVIVRQTDYSWFLSFAASDPSAEVLDWVTYDGQQLYHVPLGQRLTSAYTLSNSVIFDSEGTKYPPNACLSCHGGQLTSAGVTGATLLPLDPGLIRPTTFSIGGIDYYYDAGNVRKVNQAVISVSPSAAVARYLIGLYGMDPHIATGPGDPNYVPQGWTQQANTYNTAIKSYCVMCHLAGPSNLDFTVPNNFYQNKDLIYAAVCSGHSMPHAEAPYKAFWTKDTGPFFMPGWLIGQLGYQSCP